ncbi:MAG: hypothetical protein N3A01_08950 [Bacteroidales bacterium]|nr:hypothetical protein [Bacteroidales bacterium]
MNISLSTVEKIISIIKEQVGYDFSQYHKESIVRRLERVIEEYNLKHPDELLTKMTNNPVFTLNVIDIISITTTEWFRDPCTWKEFVKVIIPDLAKKEKFNIWHIACSTGQEAYSLYFLLDIFDLVDRANIIATDMNSNAIFRAREGVYYLYIEKDFFKNIYEISDYIGKDIFNTYYYIDEKESIFGVKKEYLNKIKFYKHNILTDPLPENSSFDVIFCRNLLIYLNTECQNLLIYKLYRILKEKCFLFLGYHETLLGPVSDLFDKVSYFYRKKEIK